MPKIWVGQTTRNGEKKRGWPNTSIQEFYWNELSEKDVIGSGSFGYVITAIYHGKTIVKKLLKQHERDLRLFYKEANILQFLDSRFGRGLGS